MAETYKNAAAAVGTSWAAVYTCPADTTAIILGAQLSNVDGAATVTGVGVRLNDSSATAQFVYLQDGEIPVGQALQPVSGERQVLEAGDAVEAIAGAASDVEAVVSVVEVT